MVISASIAARGLKFWLQVALLAPIATRCAEIRKSRSGSGKSGFSGNFFFAFFGFYGLLGPQGHPPDAPEPPNPDPDPGNPVFRKKGFSFWCRWTPLDLRVDPWWSLTVSGPPGDLKRPSKVPRLLCLFKLKPL